VHRLAALSTALSIAILATPQASAQIRRSNGDAAPSPGRATSAINTPAAPAAVAALPRIALLRPDRYSNFADDEDMAYERLGNALANLGRFTLVERGRIDAILRENQLGIDGLLQGQGRLTELTSVDYLVEINVSNEVMTQTGKDRAIIYNDQWIGSCRLIEVRRGIVARSFPIDTRASGDSMAQARGRAADQFVASALAGFRDVFRLQTRIVGRQGKLVQLEMGSNNGMQDGYVFSALRALPPVMQGALAEAPTLEVGRIAVTRTMPGGSMGVIIEGADRIRDDDLLVEDPGASLMRLGLFVGGQSQNAKLVGATATDALSTLGRVQFEVDILEPYSGQSFGVALGAASGTYGQNVSPLKLDLLAQWQLPLGESLRLILQGGVGINAVNQPLKAPVRVGEETVSSAQSSSVTGVAGAAVDLRLWGPLNLRAGAYWRPEAIYRDWSLGSGNANTPVAADAVNITTVQDGGLAPTVGLFFRF